MLVLQVFTYFVAIRIFGVYTHAELENLRPFWTSVSKQLSKKGKVYQDRWDHALLSFLERVLIYVSFRCTFRNKHHAGDKTTTPRRFEINSLEGDEVKQPLVDLRDQDLEEVSSSSAHCIVL